MEHITHVVLALTANRMQRWVAEPDAVVKSNPCPHFVEELLKSSQHLPPPHVRLLLSAGLTPASAIFL
jgi:hypothetical protein